VRRRVHRFVIQLVAWAVWCLRHRTIVPWNVGLIEWRESRYREILRELEARGVLPDSFLEKP